ncbi:MAG TPA: hypothetical protein VNM92_04050 [Thermoanaerobaculia bacterium]|nr:hypothetical protein [Thermoanaerobaculia bacterium]
MTPKYDPETKMLLGRLQSASFTIAEMRRQVKSISPLLEEQEQFHLLGAIARLEADSLNLESILGENQTSH